MKTPEWKKELMSKILAKQKAAERLRNEIRDLVGEMAELAENLDTASYDLSDARHSIESAADLISQTI